MDEQNREGVENSLKEAEELKVKCDEYLNGWKRAKADFINYQKDEAKRLVTITQFANEAIIRDLLIVLDSFDLAFLSRHSEFFGSHSERSEESRDKLREESLRGFYLIQNQLEEVLKKHGLEKIVVNVGDNFDPLWHEAVAEVESSGQSANTIAEILESGYTLHGKVIRVAKVRIIK